MTGLGDDWLPNSEGIPSRNAARVVVIDPEGSVLLLHGHDGDDPDYQWWFTVGGGLEPDESSRAGAARELVEETGFCIHPDDLVGPVAHRVADFEFTNLLARQHEDFFLLFVTDIQQRVDTSRHTGNEQKLVDGWGWFSVPELFRLEETQLVFPRGLAELARRWVTGWDGSVWHLYELAGSH